MNRPQKILLLGSGALKIGQAGEFDYSGSQAIKACKEAGAEVILVNPNIATNQTSRGVADKVYFVPVDADFVTGVIEKEKPDAILLAWGGQTALNTGIELEKRGILEKHNVKVLGTPVSVIETTEDREAFNAALDKIGVKYPRSVACRNEKEAWNAVQKITYPVIVRAAFALGGGGSGFAENDEEFEKIVQKAFSFSPQILVEESLKGWKEIEYEVVRDAVGNKITVCNMENFDPLGIHTGESIVVAPSQTLNDHEYQKLRSIALKTIEHLGVVGECNIQYALDPYSDDYRVIEVNARLSRSSALASKATGYPLAFVAAQIALGKTLPEIQNAVTGTTSAMFEPSLDYVALKIPRWDLNKFRKVSDQIGSEMKSVGEIMALGRTFEEALQKGLRMLQIGAHGLAIHPFVFPDICAVLKKPTPRRIFAIYEALKSNVSLEEISKITGIDFWFLSKMDRILRTERLLQKVNPKQLENISDEVTLALQSAKEDGFSDAEIEKIWNGEFSENDIRGCRKRLGILPVVKKIDTLAAEFPAETNYLFWTYHGKKNDIENRTKIPKALVIGSGPYSIGSSVEFDWCCVNAVQTLRKKGMETIMLNSNPETVSTDYETGDYLFFDELSLERTLDVIDLMAPTGTILFSGGQIPNNLAPRLGELNIPILGTHPDNIDQAENRHLFSCLCDELDIDQPEWREFATLSDAEHFAEKVGYPVLVRPSKVLSGAAMAVARDGAELENFLGKASKIDSDAPVVVSKFEVGAREIEIDAVAHKGEIILHAISEHIENAGVHSGDATIVFPPQKTYLETIRRIKLIAKKLAKALSITGPFNIQFLAKNNAIKVIELNLRASRSFPFVSKVSGINFIEVATRAALGEVEPPEERRKKYRTLEMDHVGVKCPQFSFSRLSGADPVLSVEMASTGEVGCFGRSFEEAFLKSMISVGFHIPQKGVLFSAGDTKSKFDLLPVARFFFSSHLQIFATPGTADFFTENGIIAQKLPKISASGDEKMLGLIRSKEIDLVINIPKNYAHEEVTDGYRIRRAAIDANVSLVTNVQVARSLALSLEEFPTMKSLPILSEEEYF
ncbi:carbamoyl-phosphate synthase (glutamine-hydrolyzing) large subunit [Candidatus Peregrinibacteria bacterium]|nr:MAG: carbamoyl-phosphate synthase (glutamine-hydrolyzing) large subunit [Candidatus Peregrinibacteria bacterium]